mmetsp:Transcript_67007/g.158026  ORF Transcript_67007/g.158026 Transcript_67007/m.158026 type:complete len:177 (+) Transcript_67007:71-601(+)
MGQGSSSSQDKKPLRSVPTTSQVKKANLESKWWSHQISGAASTPMCLDGYGKQYAGLFERHCGECRKEHQRCIKQGKFDPLEMQKWYPVCGEGFEMESACAAALLRALDERCRAPLNRAAEVLASKGQDDARLPKHLEAIGTCISQMASDKALQVSVDTAEVKRRTQMAKQLLARS